jgi:hypothetical protein
VVLVVHSDDEVSSDDDVPLQRRMRARGQGKSTTYGPPLVAPAPRPTSSAAARAMVPGGPAGDAMVVTRATVAKEVVDAAVAREAAEEAAKKKSAEEAATRKMVAEEAVGKKKATEEAAVKKAAEEAAVKRKAADEAAAKKKALEDATKKTKSDAVIAGSGSIDKSQEGGCAQWLYTSGQVAIPRLLEASVHYATLYLPFLVACL